MLLGWRFTQYFGSRDVAAIAVCSALWGVLNAVFSPVFFHMFGLPFLCDIIGFSVLAVAAWWIRKLGTLTMIGLIATLVTLIINPAQLLFLGFTAASVVFDLLARAIGYDKSFKKRANAFISMVSISIVSAAVAGYIIGAFFMAGPALAKWGGVSGWAGLHAIGGVMGGLIGASLIVALTSRKVKSR